MIDLETEIFIEVEDALLEVYPDLYMLPSVTGDPAEFPAVVFYEADNSVVNRYRTQDTSDQRVQLMYEVQVYSNKAQGAKTETKQILKVIDEKMLAMGFSRIMSQQLTNLYQPSVARRIARYEAVADARGVIYRR